MLNTNHIKNGLLSVGYFLVALSFIVSNVWHRQKASKVVSQAKKYNGSLTTLFAVNKS